MAAASEVTNENGEHISTRRQRNVCQEALTKEEIRELLEKIAAPPHPDFELDVSAMLSADEVAEKMYQAVPGNFE